MNIRLLLDLVRYHYQKNDVEFERVANEIANAFRRSGKYEVADYIRAQMSSRQSLRPQSLEREVESNPLSQFPSAAQQLSDLFVEVPTFANPLPMPLQLDERLRGVSLAIDKRKILSKAYKEAELQAQAIAEAAGKSLKQCVKVDFKPFTTYYVSQTTIDSDMMHAKSAKLGAAPAIINTFTPEDIELSETLYCLWIAE